jgi:hypothetical protein
MVVMLELEPRTLRTDNAFRLQLARPVRSLTDHLTRAARTSAKTQSLH